MQECLKSKCAERYNGSMLVFVGVYSISGIINCTIVGMVGIEPGEQERLVVKHQNIMGFRKNGSSQGSSQYSMAGVAEYFQRSVQEQKIRLSNGIKILPCSELEYSTYKPLLESLLPRRFVEKYVRAHNEMLPEHRPASQEEIGELESLVSELRIAR